MCSEGMLSKEHPFFCDKGCRDASWQPLFILSRVHLMQPVGEVLRSRRAILRRYHPCVAVLRL